MRTRWTVGLILLGLLPSAPVVAEATQADVDICVSETASSAQKIESCSDLLNEAEMSDQQRSIFLNYRGVANSQTGQLDLALDDFNAAIALVPHPSIYYNRSEVLEAKVDYPGAINDLTLVVKANPDFVKALSRRGILYVLTRQPNKAVEDFDRVIALRPAFADAYYDRGMAYDISGKVQPALADLSKTLELNPKHLFALISRSAIFTMMDNNKATVADLDRAIQIAPDRADLYATRCFAFRRLKQDAKADTDCAEAGELDPQLVPQLVRGHKGEIHIDHQTGLITVD